MDLDQKAGDGPSWQKHVPVFDEQQSADFDRCLQRLGPWNTTGRSYSNDGAPGIVRLYWKHPQQAWCSEDGHLDFLDQRLHRQVLHWLLHSHPLSKAERLALRYSWMPEEDEAQTTWTITHLAMALKREEETLLPILRFLAHQTYLVEQRAGAWTAGPALASVLNLGATLEWCVQAHLQRTYRAIARRCVHFQEWEPLLLNDLDILAFTQDLVITAECKSSTAIKPDHLQRFVRRAQLFPADIALFLIDTESLASVSARASQIRSFLGSDVPEDAQTQQDGSLIVFLPPNIYLANIGTSISGTLDVLLQLGRAWKTART